MKFHAGQRVIYKWRYTKSEPEIRGTIVEQSDTTDDRWLVQWDFPREGRRHHSWAHEDNLKPLSVLECLAEL